MKKLRKLKKGLAILLAVAMVAGLMPDAGTMKVSAASGVTYLSCDKNGENWTTLTCASAAEVTSEDTAWGESSTDTWYVVNSDVTIGSADTIQRVTVK